jgi:hypothetical protein
MSATMLAVVPASQSSLSCSSYHNLAAPVLPRCPRLRSASSPRTVARTCDVLHREQEATARALSDRLARLSHEHAELIAMRASLDARFDALCAMHHARAAAPTLAPAADYDAHRAAIAEVGAGWRALARRVRELRDDARVLEDDADVCRARVTVTAHTPDCGAFPIGIRLSALTGSLAQDVLCPPSTQRCGVWLRLREDCGWRGSWTRSEFRRRLGRELQLRANHARSITFFFQIIIRYPVR